MHHRYIISICLLFRYLLKGCAQRTTSIRSIRFTIGKVDVNHIEIQIEIRIQHQKYSKENNKWIVAMSAHLTHYITTFTVHCALGAVCVDNGINQIIKSGEINRMVQFLFNSSLFFAVVFIYSCLIALQYEWVTGNYFPSFFILELWNSSIVCQY